MNAPLAPRDFLLIAALLLMFWVVRYDIVTPHPGAVFVLDRWAGDVHRVDRQAAERVFPPSF